MGKFNFPLAECTDSHPSSSTSSSFCKKIQDFIFFKGRFEWKNLANKLNGQSPRHRNLLETFLFSKFFLL